MTTKELLHSNKDQAKAMLAMVTSETFSRLLMYSKAELIVSNPGVGTEGIAAISKFLGIMQELPEPAPGDDEFTGAGLVHDVAAAAQQLKDEKAQGKA